MKENSIEEDIKIVEDFIDVALVFLPKYSTKKVEKTIDEESYIAIKHILSDYKRLQEEYKAVDYECSRLERKEVEMEKIIDLIIKDLYKQAHISTRCYLQISIEECMKNKNCIECLKQYFINNTKEVK